jgi:mannose-6-phosphate isomerase-like protein (cupin superfamily)
MNPGANTARLARRIRVKTSLLLLTPALTGMGVAFFLAASVLVHAAPQTSASAGAGDKAEFWTQAEMDGQLSKLLGQSKASGSYAETVLANYGSHAVRLIVRTTDGEAEVHMHSDDVFVVINGPVSFITGGTVIAPKTGNNGEIRGSGIRGGSRRTLSAGAVVHIPAGTPHQTLVQSGTIFDGLLIKVKE